MTGAEAVRIDRGHRARAVRLAAVLVLSLSAAGCRESTRPAADLAGLPWDSVTARARGTAVTWRMWRGDPAIDAYVDRWVAPRVKQRFDIALHAVEGQGPELVNQLQIEREARARGSADLVWINGETFHNLRRSGLLYGPWSDRLPNAAYVDSASPTIRRDFEQNPAGYESPWGTVQFALIYDSARTPSPPRSYAELAAWIHRHPGRFTYDQSFAGVTFLKQLMYALNGGVARFQGGWNERLYQQASPKVWAWLDEVRPALWRRGDAYPPGVAELHRLFANDEVDFTMSNNQNEVVSKIRQGLFPPTARALLLRDGTIANAHFVGIPASAPNPAGAMVVADFLLSPEAQLEKAKPEVWADGTVLDPVRLPAEWRARFEAAAGDPRALPRDSLARYARPEVAPEYHERIAADWRARIRRRGD
ncbi:MAG TPA: ABC transporter substrate-binding protein [Gemmatimonadales bacterium]|nr:ABC transporter substrate-binding protein [Gemmatimonadales bacterium]